MSTYIEVDIDNYIDEIDSDRLLAEVKRRCENSDFYRNAIKDIGLQIIAKESKSKENYLQIITSQFNLNIVQQSKLIDAMLEIL